MKNKVLPKITNISAIVDIVGAVAFFYCSDNQRRKTEFCQRVGDARIFDSECRGDNIVLRAPRHRHRGRYEAFESADDNFVYCRCGMGHLYDIRAQESQYLLRRVGMIYAFVAAVVSAALLIYFIVRIVRDPGDAKYAVHIPKCLFFFGMAVYIAGAAVCVAMLAVGKFFVAIPGFGCMLFGAAAMLCQLDQKVVSAGEGIYVYSTMFGKKKRFNISDFVSMKRNSDSLTLKFKNGKMHIDNLAVISDGFRKSLLDGKKD